MNNNMQPIFILPEGSTRNTGKSAQRANIAAARAAAETVRTTLGPKGMDKMLVDSMGDVVITNDGVTILDEMEIEHPAAKMMLEIAKVQENEIGDGTTTAVILGGELLKNAEELLEKNIHPAVIANGYKLALEKSLDILPKLSKNITPNDKTLLTHIAITAMTGKNVEMAREKLAEMAVESVLKVMENNDNNYTINTDNIKLVKKEGAGVIASHLVNGIVLDKERVHTGMPRSIKDAKIALLECEIEVRNTETDAKIQLTDPRQLQAFLDHEEKVIKDMVEKIVASGAKVVFCQKGIDDAAQHYLAKKGVYAIRRVKESDITALAKATDAKVVANINELTSDDLGYAGLVEERKIHKEDMTFVENCKNPRAVSIILRGGTKHVVTEVERAMTDAIGDISASITVGKYVAGGGAIEIELSRRLRAYAEQLSGRVQLAVQAFADSLEIIPNTLAENSGLDPINVITNLKVKHDNGEIYAGIDIETGGSRDMVVVGVIEPLKIKTQALQSATEAAIMLLRIDDIIAAHKINKGTGSPQMSPGMPGMGM